MNAKPDKTDSKKTHKEELFECLREAVSHLPVDLFTRCNECGEVYTNWEDIAVVDFSLHYKEFAKAMRHIKCVQLDNEYYD